MISTSTALFDSNLPLLAVVFFRDNLNFLRRLKHGRRRGELLEYIRCLFQSAHLLIEVQRS